VHQNSIIYNKPTRCKPGSIVFINNYKNTPHVSDAKGVRNMWSILVVVNKHNTVRVASCWFIIYYKMGEIFYIPGLSAFLNITICV